eukprot:673808-Rhodomonas_salina.1
MVPKCTLSLRTRSVLFAYGPEGYYFASGPERSSACLRQEYYLSTKPKTNGSATPCLELTNSVYGAAAGTRMLMTDDITQVCVGA